MPKARPWRTMRSKSSDAVCAICVVLDEELLELVDDQQRARHRLGAAGLLVAGDVLHAELAEHVAAPLQFLVHALQHAQRKLAIALDRHDARVRQPLRGVALELDAFLEVDEVELDLLRAAREREVRDDDVEERRFARARLAREERVLARAFADREILHASSRRCGRSATRSSFVVSFVHMLVRRGAICANGTSTRFESMLALPILWTRLRGEFRRRAADRARARRRPSTAPARARSRAVLAADADAVLAQFLRHESIGQRLALVPVNEREDAAARSARRRCSAAASPPSR